ncbi:MAG TPA: SDR family NAD(P)-dependent oxidoreductase [Anaeromyxobacteraceae bacterium]|nr:SDR family NAD(P)-dependent oxidoreductase [Anaeromyxobacteraceae bacterium]
MSDRHARAVAVVGIGALLPDAPDAPSFWKNLCERRYSITDVPPERWSVDDYYDPDPSAPDKTYSKIGAWVRGYSFDWQRYRVPPRVAAAMDQGQQWAVSIAAEALADYGFPGRALDLERTGVVLGAAMGGELHYLTTLRVMFPEFRRALEGVETFAQLGPDVRREIVARWQDEVGKHLPAITEDSMPGELPNIISGRVANILNLRGPNFITDAACASSFAAVDAATDLLVEDHCDAVITGGVDRNMGASTFVKFCKIGALSATGTRPFGEGADGFVMGEGAAAFLLKRLSDAERDGDRIYAVIRGVGASSDGKGKGITAPNPAGQKLAVRRAWQDAGLDPATAGLVEAHGTSTKVGDVVEVESLAECFAGAGRGAIALGSVKSNVGHLKAGAGAAGLLKAVLALHHRQLPPTLHAERPNPSIEFPATPFTLNHELREWPRSNGTPRRAGVSAYGFGGTNFHVVLEEHVPGMIDAQRRAAVSVPAGLPAGGGPAAAAPAAATPRSPVRGVLALGAPTVADLRARLARELARAKEGAVPPAASPSRADLGARERLVVDFEGGPDLVEKLERAGRALEADAPMAWKALANQGVFRGANPAAGKIAFLFPGQGSQFVNMGRTLHQREPAVRAVFEEADAVLAPILGRPLTAFLFADPADAAAMARAEEGLRQTAITQPAVLTVDNALRTLLAEFGMRPDYVMGHSLGEYGALVAAGAMPFADALEASAARGREMTRVSLADNGWMAAVMGPLDVVEKTLASIDGYVVTANLNSGSQAVIGGETEAVKRAMEALAALGIETVRLPVSHAFHTRIVAPAAGPLGEVLDRLRISSPRLPVVANVTGGLYPGGRREVRDMLVEQIASPVQWVRGLETLWREGVRTFVEVGPKKALKGFVDDVLGGRDGLVSLFTNHPKLGELAAFNQALCGLYAAGHGAPAEPAPAVGQRDAPPVVAAANAAAPAVEERTAATMAAPRGAPEDEIMSNRSVEELAQVLARTVAAMAGTTAAREPGDGILDRNRPPPGSVVITGCGLGLPGPEKPVMDPRNVDRILRGEQLIDLLPVRFRDRMARKQVTRVVKTPEGDGRFETIDDSEDVLKLAGRPGPFDLAAEYGVPGKLVEALDTTTQLAIAAGIDALREAGIPLVQTWRRTTKGTFLPDRWALPESMRDETGVIFGSAFPGLDRFAEALGRFYRYESRCTRRAALDEVRRQTSDPSTLRELQRQLAQIDEELHREPYAFDRRFLLRVLPMGHSQFAEYIGARGPNAQANAACASTAQAVAMAEDWIRTGRCRRVVVISADNPTSDNLIEWMGAGFLASGAAATDDKVEEAAVPFDRRRHGMIIGMGAAALVVESQDAVEERGMRGIVELLSSETRNSAFHATRLDVDHVAATVESLVRSAERRFGLDRRAMAPELVFMSHETFTPARGGSASAEVAALRRVFGGAASEIVVSNTKGFTGHAMGVGVEDVVAVKILEHGIVPPVPNFREEDPELGVLNLSRGGRYPVNYAIHLAAGFGSQIALTLTRRIPGGAERVDRPDVHRRWLEAVTGSSHAETEVVQRTLRVVSTGAPARAPQPATWEWGTAPRRRAPAPPSLPPVIRREAPAATASNPTAAPISTPTPTAASTATATAIAIPTAVPVPTASTIPTSTAPAAPAPAAADPVVDRVVAIVSEKTGYPTDLLDMDLDLEADLGVDTVKQAETFAAVREEWSIPRIENLRLRDFPTLRHVVGFVREHRPDLATRTATATAAAAATPTASPTPTPSATPTASPADPVTARVVAIVSEKTGYPPDLLDMDLDLEADLGVDTVKQAETFAAVREEWSIPRIENLRLRDFPTLRHVVGFVRDRRPDLGSAPAPVAGAVTATATAAAPSTGAAPAGPGAAQARPLAGADEVPRRVATPVLRPPLELCKPTGVRLGAGVRVVVARGAGEGILARRLAELGATALELDARQPAGAIESAVRGWLADGPIQGIFWLAPVDPEARLDGMSNDDFRERTRVVVKNLASTMRVLYGSVAASGTFLVAATRLGGLFGLGDEGTVAPLGGAVQGFVKAYKRERRDALVKVVDFSADAGEGEIADALVAEALADPGTVEVGRRAGTRWSIGLDTRPAEPSPSIRLGRDSVFVVTGAAGGITSAIVADLAAASGGTFHLLDLIAPPAADDPHVVLFRAGRERLKEALIAEAKGRGEKPTPAALDRQLLVVERQEAALRALASVQAAGGTAQWHAVDLLDAASVRAAVDAIRAASGRIDVLVHAGGIEISRALPDKPDDEWARVFDVKAEGFFSLLRAAQDLPLGATVVFSSIAGRFGNAGQTDYSAANALLCAMSRWLRRARPETRAIAIDWTAWGGIGMATRGSIPKIMEAAGIDMLAPEVGIPTVRRELLAGVADEIVVGGRLGVLVEDWDAAGGLDLEKTMANRHAFTMVGEVTGAPLNEGLAVETCLDPGEEPFLLDHQIQGVPVLPGVMGIEAFAQAASVLCPDRIVTGLHDVEFLLPFKFHRMNPATLYLAAAGRPGTGDTLRVDVRLSSRLQPNPGMPVQERLHFRGSVVAERAALAGKTVAFHPPADVTVDDRAIYRVYFHGPAYRVLEGVRLDDGHAIGVMRRGLPPNAREAGAAELVAPRLVELCFQTAGIIDIAERNVLGLPARLGSLRVRRAAPPGDSRIFAEVWRRDEGDGFDAHVVDADGNVYVELSDYRTVALPEPKTLGDLRGPVKEGAPA